MIGLPILMGTISASHAPASPQETEGTPTFLETPPTPVATDSTKSAPDSLKRVGSTDGSYSTFRTMDGTYALKPSDEPSSTVPPREPLKTPFPSLNPPPSSPAVPEDFTQGVWLPVFKGLEDISDYTNVHRKGALTYALRLYTSAIYDDNISLRKAQKQKDLQLAIGPAAQIQIGDADSLLRLAGTYAGATSWFTKNPQERSLDQTIGLGAGMGRGRLQFALRSGFQTTHQSSRDAGNRVGRRVAYVGSTASWQMSGKTSADISADYTKSDYNTLLNSRELRFQEYLNYQYSPKLQFGIGGAQGVLDATGSRKQNYFQGLARIIAAPTSKIAFNVSAGNEWRHFESKQPSTTAPVFGLGAGWQATAKTGFSLDLRRHTFASAALAAENYESTTVSMTAHELLTQNLNAAVTVGLERAKYSASSPGTLADRNDNFSFTRAGLNWAVRKSCSLETFYEFSQNQSAGSQAQSFSRNRIGISININF
jgi:Putative beta-barrel porin 2